MQFVIGEIPPVAAIRLKGSLARRKLLLVCAWFMLTRVVAVGATHLGATQMTETRRVDWNWGIHKGFLFQGTPPTPFLAPLVRWDANFYVALARSGYPPRSDQRPYAVAFFPLYPLVLSALGFLGVDTFWAAFAVSNLGALAAALVLAMVRVPVAHRGVAFRSALLLLASPGSNFLSYPYPESLFALFLCAAFVALLNERLLVAGAFGALATATRSAGAVVPVALLVEAWRHRHNRQASRKYLAAAILSLVGVGLFAIWCSGHYGDAFAFARIQEHYDRALSILGPVKALLRFNVDPDYYLVTLVALVAAIWMALRPPLWRAVAAAFLLWLPMATGTLKAMIRYQGVNVPLLMGVSQALFGRRFRIVLAASMTLMTLEAILFGMGIGHY